MGVAGMGRRRGAAGLIKYTEPQTIATTRVMNLGGPRGVPPKLWSKVMPPFVKAMQWLPGR
ncbi:MAG: succinic semialdehyde dehydrogenase, partial [Rhodococcus ruber]|nr:succinic semialdehyde dehydrogenase [Rhodococcus ruber]